MLKKRDIRRTIGRRIKYYREQQGLSQEVVGKLAGLHRSYIGGVERGERNIGVDNLAKIAKALGMKPWQLLHEDS